MNTLSPELRPSWYRNPVVWVDLVFTGVPAGLFVFGLATGRQQLWTLSLIVLAVKSTQVTSDRFLRSLERKVTATERFVVYGVAGGILCVIMLAIMFAIFRVMPATFGPNTR
jgi:ABC-type cobalamin transport system permease subunit